MQGDHSVAGLVIGGQAFLVIGHHHRATLRSEHDLVLGLLEFLHGHRPASLARGEKRRLVHEVGEIGAGEARRAARDGAGVHTLGKRRLAHMDLEDLLAADNVRVRHNDLAVEAAWPQQRRIENVRTVGRRDQDDTLIRLETVHLDEHLVQGLLALVIAAAETGAAMTADCVDLVDEDDAGGVLLALLEHVTHTAGADADKHLDEVRTGNGEEGNIGLTGDRLGEQRLTGPRRAHQQHALGNLAAKALELAGILQELDDLFKLCLGLVDTGDILEGHAPLMLGQQFRARLAKAHRAAGPALHLAHEKHPDADEQQHREPGQQDRQEGRHAAVLGAGNNADIVRIEHLHNVGPFRHHRGDDTAILCRALEVAAVDHNLDDLLALDFSDEVGIGHLAARRCRRRALEQIEERQQRRAKNQPDDDIASHVVHGLCLPSNMLRRAGFKSTGGGVKMIADHQCLKHPARSYGADIRPVPRHLAQPAGPAKLSGGIGPSRQGFPAPAGCAWQATECRSSPGSPSSHSGCRFPPRQDSGSPHRQGL